LIDVKDEYSKFLMVEEEEFPFCGLYVAREVL
jgi:hypothetical protein